MSLQQFEQLQSQIVKLNPEQLMALQSQIASKLAKEQESSPLVTDEEMDMISSLFN
ncbi:hypothetical protein P7F88_03540 [Vibrio hannami]|uniref:hypothetical protein n=1 Tax=Vibrio hannami TaxID=2717094 RepID=UPI00240EA49A|nr:hypothetical protein [Vibrio hannami]MDG3085222.1 hypothetical protein [Vibrio hannami]